MMLKNIVSYLKILAGGVADKVRFTWPTDEEVYAETWKRSVILGATQISFGTEIPEEFVIDYSKEQILARYDHK